MKKNPSSLSVIGYTLSFINFRFPIYFTFSRDSYANSILFTVATYVVQCFIYQHCLSSHRETSIEMYNVYEKCYRTRLIPIFHSRSFENRIVTTARKVYFFADVLQKSLLQQQLSTPFIPRKQPSSWKSFYFRMSTKVSGIFQRALKKP